MSSVCLMMFDNCEFILHDVRLVLVSDMDLVGLVKQGLLGDETKLELLETDKGRRSEKFGIEDLQGSNWEQGLLDFEACRTMGGSWMQGESDVVAFETTSKSKGSWMQVLQEYRSWREDLQEGRSILWVEEVKVNLVDYKGSWMQEKKSKREACESSNGCWKQVEVDAKVKRLGLDLS
ncbi:hypothetical protein A2U01_0000054 [Trifolium medium]|uniref:Uncharacterized protein n=1 Tax=Trifolium medium TaxID=97028 RepID=A0A392LWG3_9FABA|nr:hypothetical protein [Trifolium medium]